MTVSDRRRTCAAIWCTLFVGLLLVSSASAVEKNDNDDSNNLGLLTSACADNFCRNGVSGLDLWLSLEEACDVNTQPYLENLMSQPSKSSMGVGGWPVSVAAVVWVGVWVVSMYAGYRSGMKVGSQSKGLYPVA